MNLCELKIPRLLLGLVLFGSVEVSSKAGRTPF